MCRIEEFHSPEFLFLKSVKIPIGRGGVEKRNYTYKGLYSARRAEGRNSKCQRGRCERGRQLNSFTLVERGTERQIKILATQEKKTLARERDICGEIGAKFSGQYAK